MQAADAINKSVPPSLRDSLVTFTNNNGHVVAIAGKTGENIGAAIANAGKEIPNPADFIKNAAQAKGAFDATKNKSGSNGGGNKPKNEPKPNVSESDTHEYGTYRGSAKHHPNSPDDIGKNPRDEFMKNYKPLLRRVIPREIAIEWLEQAMKVYRELFASEEKFMQACKENNW